MNNCNCGVDRGGLKRGTTPPIYIDLPDALEWTDIAEMWVTVSQAGMIIINKTLDDVETETIGDVTEHFVTLTQSETLKLDSYFDVEIQVRLRDNSGNACSSDVYRVSAGRILKDGVI